MNEKKDYQGSLYAPHPDLYEKRRKLGLNNKETSRSPIINTEEQMNVEYAAQRKDRMQDAIDDTSMITKYQRDKRMKRCYLASMM